MSELNDTVDNSIEGMSEFGADTPVGQAAIMLARVMEACTEAILAALESQPSPSKKDG